MEETNILSQFRDNWKKELQSKPDSKVEGEKQGVQLGEKSTEGKSYFDSNRNTQIETAVSKASYTCTTYDFKTHTSVCDPDFSVPCSAISSHNEVSTGKSDKRKCKINPLGSKKTKVSKLDDIFCEKAKGVIPKERLLDQLIQDIVSSYGQLSKNNLLKIAIIFLSISLNMCFGCSKEPSHQEKKCSVTHSYLGACKFSIQGLVSSF